MKPLEFINIYELPMCRFDEPYFSYYLERLDPYFNTLALWEDAKNTELDVFGKVNINRKKGHEKEVFYDRYIYEVATQIAMSDGYDDFLNAKPIEKHSNYSGKIYKQELVGKKLVSFDLKSANYQMLCRYIKLPESFVDFAVGLGVPLPIAKSKRFRQICLNSLGVLASDTYTTLSKNTMIDLREQLEKQGTIVAVMMDEVVMLDEGQEFTFHFDYPVLVDEEHFILGALVKDETKGKMELSTKKSFFAKKFKDKVTLHATPKDYYPMMLSYLEGKELTELDLNVMRNKQGILHEALLQPLPGVFKFD